MTGPQFVDNREGNTFAKTIREHLSELRNSGESPEELCIATGYFNAAGWLKVSKEVHHLNKVRLLIGAEPSLNQEMSFRRPGDPKEPTRTTKQVQEILKGQVLGLKKERDQGFDFNLEGFGQLQKLMEFFRSENVEVRRHEKRFFHAKAWLLRGKNRGVLAGSSNLTAAGLQRNLELNLGHYQDPLLDQVESWYDEVWEDSEPFDLAEIYAALFSEFPPWIIYLRVLWELYGDELEEEEEELGHLTLTTVHSRFVELAKLHVSEMWLK